MHPRCRFAVVMLFAALFFLLGGTAAVNGRYEEDKKAKDCPPLPDGCKGSACPVILYASYGSYCSYYAQYCTGNSADLVNISVDSNCCHTMMPPYCDGDCTDCIPLGSYMKKKNKKGVRPPPVHAHKDIR